MVDEISKNDILYNEKTNVLIYVLGESMICKNTLVVKGYHGIQWIGTEWAKDNLVKIGCI